MKFLIATICVSCMSVLGSAQNNAIDSLDRLINRAASDTARINLLNGKIALLGNSNIDTAINLGRKTLQEAIKINYKKGEGEVRLKLARTYCFKGDYKAAAENLHAAETIFKQLKDSLNIARLYAGYGMMYGMQSRYDTAIQYYQLSAAINERNNKLDEMAKSYSNLAACYQMQSDFIKALQYQQKSLKIAEDKKDEVMQASTLVNIGITYRAMDDILRSEQALLKAAELARKQHEKITELYAYSNLASVYNTKNELQKAYEYAMKSAALGGEMGDQGIQSAGLSKAASSLAKQQRFDEAEKLASQAIAIADSSHQPLVTYQAYNTLGYVFKIKGKYKEAVPYYEKAFAAMKGADLYDEQIGWSYAELSECYEKIGNYSKAFSTYKMSSQIKDSIARKENVRKATELTMNYEFDKKQQVAKVEQERKNAVTKSRQLALLIGLGLTLVLAAVAFKAYRNKQKSNALLKQQKEEIQSALTKLKSTQAQLIQSEKMASLGELTAGIAHEIQNPLNFVNNFSEVNKELVDELQQELKAGKIDVAISISNDIKDNEQKINHHGKRADAIVKGMLQHSQKSSGQKELTDINALADEYLRLSYHGMRAKDKSFNAKIQTDFDNSIDKINIIPQDIGRVLLNLYNNAFYAVAEKMKFQTGSYEPTVLVSTKKINDKVEISVKDNGNGIPQNIVDKIFQPFFTTKPTGQGTGLGLSLSYDIIKAHGGEIKVETKEGEGTTFKIYLPV